MNLSRQIKAGLRNQVVWGLLVIATAALILHLIWVVYDRKQTTRRLQSALNHVLQEPVQERDIISIKRVLQAFRYANPGAEICVRTGEGVQIEEPSCEGMAFVEYPFDLSSGGFSIGVRLPWATSMVVGGGLMLLMVALLAATIAHYLRRLSRDIADDLELLLDFDGTKDPKFSELKAAKRKIAEGIRAERAAQIARADAAVGVVVAQVAHDIRSPLSALRAAVTGLEGCTSEERQLILGATGRIEQVARSLMALRKSKLEGASVRPTITRSRPTTELKGLIDGLLAEKRLEHQTQHSGLKFISKIAEGAEFTAVYCEHDSLVRTLSNLINNGVEAIEGASGRVSVSVSVVSGYALVSVSDTGKGMPEERLTHLFERGRSFGKADGSGLGLSSAREAVESMGGCLSIHSKPGEGTTVSLNLPVAATAG